MKATGELIAREIAGEKLLIPVGETATRLHSMITVTESGMLIWNLLQEECTEDDLVAAILKEYDADEAAVREDVAAFLDKLDALKLLVR